MPRSQRGFVLVALVVGLSGLACRRTSPRAAEDEVPVLVTADRAEIGTIRRFVSGTGVVVTPPDAELLVVALESGRILDLPKKVGDVVKGGEELVRFEFPSIHLENAARVAAAKTLAARLENAKLAQTKIHELFERGAASRKEVEEADKGLEQAEVEAAAAREGEAASQAAAERSVIKAPFDGLVVERFHNPGDSVAASPTDPILRIVDPKRVEVAAVIALKDANRFGIGAPARVVGEGNSQPELVHVLTRPTPEAGAQTLPIHLAFDQPTKLMAGTQVGIEIDAEHHPSALLIPAIAVVTEADKTQIVFVDVGDRAFRKIVTTGLVDAEHVEILSGLKVGDLVVTQGQANLKEGSPISASIQDRMKD